MSDDENILDFGCLENCTAFGWTSKIHELQDYLDETDDGNGGSPLINDKVEMLLNDFKQKVKDTIGINKTHTIAYRSVCEVDAVLNEIIDNRCSKVQNTKKRKIDFKDERICKRKKVEIVEKSNINVLSNFDSDALKIIISFMPDYSNLLFVSKKLRDDIINSDLPLHLNYKNIDGKQLSESLSLYKPTSIKLNYSKEIEEVVLQDEKLECVEFLTVDFDIDIIKYYERGLKVILPCSLEETYNMMESDITVDRLDIYKYIKTRSLLNVLYEPNSKITPIADSCIISLNLMDTNHFFDNIEENEKCLERQKEEKNIRKLEILSEYIDITDFAKNNSWVVAYCLKECRYNFMRRLNDVGININTFKHDKLVQDELINYIKENTGITSPFFMGHIICSFDYSVIINNGWFIFAVLQNFFLSNSFEFLRAIGFSLVAHSTKFRQIIIALLKKGQIIRTFHFLRGFGETILKEIKLPEVCFASFMAEGNEKMINALVEFGFDLKSYLKSEIARRQIFNVIRGGGNVDLMLKTMVKYGFDLNKNKDVLDAIDGFQQSLIDDLFK